MTETRKCGRRRPTSCIKNLLGCTDGAVQGWRSGESTHLPPMWSGFDFQTRRHMWVEFVGSLLCTKRFSPGTPVSPLLKNQHLTCCVNNIVNFNLQCPRLVLVTALEDQTLK